MGVIHFDEEGVAAVLVSVDAAWLTRAVGSEIAVMPFGAETKRFSLGRSRISAKDAWHGRLYCRYFWVDARLSRLNGRWVASVDTPDGPSLGWGRTA